MDKINLRQKFSLFNDRWPPKIIAELNGQYVKLAKVKGEFVWHDHKNEDELFFVVKGNLTIKLREKYVRLEEGEIFVVPKGVEHKPVTSEEAHVVVFEPKETAHTGDIKSELTVEKQDWI